MKKSTAEVVAATAAEVAPIANINGVYAHETTAIEWLVEKNPKRPSGKAHARFEKYMKATTVGDYLSAGGTKADLRYDADKGYLRLA